jgi:hypothetical protein
VVDASARARTVAVEIAVEVGGRDDLDQQFLLSQISRRGPWSDLANFPAVEEASKQTRIGLALADTEFDDERESRRHPVRARGAWLDPAKRRKSPRV